MIQLLQRSTSCFARRHSEWGPCWFWTCSRTRKMRPQKSMLKVRQVPFLVWFSLKILII